jgi:hypothetical protein
MKRFSKNSTYLDFRKLLFINLTVGKTKHTIVATSNEKGISNDFDFKKDTIIAKLKPAPNNKNNSINISFIFTIKSPKI